MLTKTINMDFWEMNEPSTRLHGIEHKHAKTSSIENTHVLDLFISQTLSVVVVFCLLVLFFPGVRSLFAGFFSCLFAGILTFARQNAPDS